MAKAYMGATVSDGGMGVFPADIHLIEGVNVIVANPNLGGIQFGAHKAALATHVMREFPVGGYQSKLRGFFVVPADQVECLIEEPGTKKGKVKR